MEAAEKLGYVRNQQAANLRKGASSVIGLIVPNLSNPFYTKATQSIHDACMARDYSVLPVSSFGTADGELKALRWMQKFGVDGVMLNASELPISEDNQSLCQQLIRQGKPLLLFGEIENPPLGAHRIRINNGEAVLKAMRYLFAKGHQRIAFVGGSRENLAMRQRHVAYEKALREISFTPPSGYSLFKDASHNQVITKVSDLMIRFGADKRPTALLAGNDSMAISAMKSLNRLSLRTPDDVAVIGFDNSDLAEIYNPALTTLNQPLERMAQDAADLLIRSIQDKTPSECKELCYEPDLIIRESA